MKAKCLNQKGLRVRAGEPACGCFHPVKGKHGVNQCGNCASFLPNGIKKRIMIRGEDNDYYS